MQATDWLKEAEVYSGYYEPSPPDARRLGALKKFPLVIWAHPYCIPDTVKEFQAQGVRALCYVSMYKTPLLDEVQPGKGFAGGSPQQEEVKASPFWSRAAADPSGKSWLIGEGGEVRRPFNNPDYPGGWDQVCCDEPGREQRVLQGVKGLMDWGFDGIFMDNVHPERICFGERLGIHKHVHPHWNNRQAYCHALERIYRLVKSYGDEKVLFLNPGRFIPEGLHWGDTYMEESFIFYEARERYGWDEVLRTVERNAPYRDTGKPVAVLSYVGGSESERAQQSYFSYAASKLFDYIWSDFCTAAGSAAERLYELRLGRPSGEAVEIGAADAAYPVYSRCFERGMVVVNPSEQEREVELHRPEGVAALRDLMDGTKLAAGPAASVLKVTVGAKSGRVILFE